MEAELRLCCGGRDSILIWPTTNFETSVIEELFKDKAIFADRINEGIQLFKMDKGAFKLLRNYFKKQNKSTLQGHYSYPSWEEPMDKEYKKIIKKLEVKNKNEN